MTLVYHVVTFLFQSSFARYMSAQGFDTWTLEVRGAGLSMHTGNSEEDKRKLIAMILSPI